MKKSQVTSLVLLLLLVAVVNQAEATLKRERFRRTVSGTILKGGLPYPKALGAVYCTTTVQYKDLKGEYHKIDDFERRQFKTNSKGDFSVRLVFDNYVDKDWKLVDVQGNVQGTCTVIIAGAQIDEFTYAGVEIDKFGYKMKDIKPRIIDIAA